MTRYRLGFLVALFVLLTAVSAVAEPSPLEYCAQNPQDIKCKAYLGAASRAYSNTGNTGGRQNFEPPNNKDKPQQQHK
jgi:hypothetical protein